jgi:hypothetical protein
VLASQLVLGINRPEYLPYPEFFISSLYWNSRIVSGWTREEASQAEDRRRLGLIYDSEGEESSTIRFVSTKPAASDPRWNDALREANILVAQNAREAAQAISDSLYGVRSANSRRRPITPLTPTAALLQNEYGVTGKRNPANVADILEWMYRLGMPPHSDASSSSPLLIQQIERAMNRRLETDGFLRQLDEALRLGALPVGARVEAVEKQKLLAELDSLTTIFSRDTPYAWFVESVQALTSEEWIQALSAKRWVDWMTTIFRVTYAFGILWELHWYERLARAVVGGRRTNQSVSISHVLQQALDQEVLTWSDHNRPVSERDVAPQVRNLIARGETLRSCFIKFVENLPPEMTAEAALSLMNDDAEFVESLEDGLRMKFSKAFGNRWEAIKYALVTRDSSGQFQDHYGLLKTYKRRFSLVDPATEWMAVVTSLACGRPGLKSNLGTVQLSFRKLGLRPSQRELIYQLEKSGLSRSTPDADLGLFVEPAF